MKSDFLLQFMNFSSKDLTVIEELFYEQTIRKNEFFLKEGDICNTIAFIKEGSLILSQVNENGIEQVLEFFFSGELISDYVSFLQDSPADTGIRALKDSTLLVISKKNLHYLYKTIPGFEKLGRLLAEKHMIKMAKKLKTRSLQPIIRYESLLNERPHIFDQVPQYLIASYLEISPEWLSKIRSQK
jgi:CRP-like cAMP-binding protein